MARSSMRRVVLLAAALAIVNAPSQARSRVALARSTASANPTTVTSVRPIRAEADMDARLARVERWLKAVMRHQPGTPDEAAVEVSQWSNAALRSLWVDTNVLLRLIRNPKAVNFSLRAEGQPRAQEIHYASVHLHRLRVLACAAGGYVGAAATPDERYCLEHGTLKPSWTATCATWRNAPTIRSGAATTTTSCVGALSSRRTLACSCLREVSRSARPPRRVPTLSE